MRDELKAMCNVIVELQDDEKKQVMMVLLSSILPDRHLDSALEVYEESKEGISVKYRNRFWSTLRTLRFVKPLEEKLTNVKPKL